VSDYGRDRRINPGSEHPKSFELRGMVVTAMLRIEFEPFLDERIRQFIADGIDYQNVAVTGLPSYFPINFILRGDIGDVLGGLLGQLWGGWLQVTHLWIAEFARGTGYGTQLMTKAENYARSRGAIGVTLETYSFQARPFYERLGYEVFGQLDGNPTGHVKFYLRKALS
jgi:GNAT superfamily N-acetyltransferase